MRREMDIKERKRRERKCQSATKSGGFCANPSDFLRAGFLGCAALLLFAGCARKQGLDSGGETLGFELPPATPVAAVTPAAATVPTAMGTPAATPPPTAAPPEEPPLPAASPSPGPSATPEAQSTPDSTESVRITIAEGFYYQALDGALKARITGMSYPADDPDVKIRYEDLRYVGILYVDFAGKTHTGELMVHRKLAKEVAEIFRQLYEAGYPLASVRLVDDYGEPGDDNKSMAANNTSAFNYRRVTGSKTLSRHSYGAAIDINPLYNPYLDGDRVAPPEAAPYVDRSKDFPGKIDHGDLAYKLFSKAGWSWGGDFKGDKDYQHFSKDIGF